jgi:hypothetical protein
VLEGGGMIAQAPGQVTLRPPPLVEFPAESRGGCLGMFVFPSHTNEVRRSANRLSDPSTGS